MSLAEILDNGASHPWANIRVQDIVADGDFTIAGGISITGDLDINGGNLNVTPGEIRTNIIQPAVPNADLVIQANGIQVFDVQTAEMRANALEVDSIDTKIPGANLQIGGANALFIQANDNILPDSDNTRDLGSALSNFANVYSHVVQSSGLFDLQLQAATGIVYVNDDLRVQNGIVAFGTGSFGGDLTVNSNIISAAGSNANVTVTPDGTGIFLMTKSGQTFGDFTVNQTLNVNGNVIPTNDDNIDIGSGSFAVRNMFLNQLRINQKAAYNQGTNITTAVSISGAESAFEITTQAASTASTATDSFTVNNSAVLASSYIFCQVVSYSGTPLTNGIPQVSINTVAGGSFVVSISNYGANALNGTFVLRFLVI